MVAVNQKMWQNQCRSKHEGSDTMIACEMSCNISKIATHIDKQVKPVRDIECVAGDSVPTSVDDNEDTNVLRGSNQINEVFVRQPQISNRSK